MVTATLVNSEKRAWAKKDGISSMLRIAADRQPVMVIRQGRFSMERSMLKSRLHTMHCFREMQLKMIEGMKHHKDGTYEYVESGPNFKGWIYEGPMEHMPFSENIGPPSVTLKLPPPPGKDSTLEQRQNYAEAVKEYMEKERASAAPAVDSDSDLVDFVIKAHFKRMVSPGYRIHIPSQSDINTLGVARGH